jgi:hypothetical protein
MLFTITNEQKIKLTLNPTTAAGNSATVDGAPVWAVIEGDATLEPAEDGLSCYLISGEANVNSKITVTADADLGEGVVSITDTVDLAVVPASASALGITAGDAELK